MAYYIRVLSTSCEPVPIEKIKKAIPKGERDVIIKLETGSDIDWRGLSVAHANGEDIILIERNLVEASSIAEGEIAEFDEDISDCKPASAVTWLREFFPRVKCIYSFQILKGTYIGNGWDIVGAAKNAIWQVAPSIIQADGEGFTNEDGYHILWQFSDSVKGKWWMGVMKEGKWIHFQMDLGNLKQRQVFQAGDIPPGAKLA